MYYFTSTINQLFFSADLPEGEKNKMIKYLEFLDESGVGEIIHDEVVKDYSKGGRTPYDPYRLFAAIIYAFSNYQVLSSVWFSSQHLVLRVL